MRMTMILAAGLAVAACGQGEGASIPGDDGDASPYSGIAEDEILHFTGTEPFWGGEVSNGQLRWSTPENIDGRTIPVERFAGRGGISFSGNLQGASFDMTVTPGECSDGMSDRDYPFTVTVAWGEETRFGCGWSDSEPYSGDGA